MTLSAMSSIGTPEALALVETKGLKDHHDPTRCLAEDILGVPHR